MTGPFARFGLRIRVALIFAGLAAGVLAMLGFGLWAGWHRLGMAGAADGFVQGGLIAGFAALGLIVWVWLLFDRNVARPAEALAASLRARAHAGAGGDIDTKPGRYLGDLAPAAAAAAARLAETQTALAEAVARETTRLADENQRLEALLSDVAAGVLLVSGQHLLVFYNGAAADLLGAAPGLDRSLFDYLHEGPIRHAQERLISAGEAEAVSDILCTTVAGARVLSARMRLLGDPGAVQPGYVLTFRDITADLAADAEREALLTETLDRLRRPAAALAAILGVLPEGEPLPPMMEAALRDEVRALSADVTDLARRHEARHGAGWIGTARASDLVEGIAARLMAAGLTAEADAAPLILRCNGFEVIALLGRLGHALADAGFARAFRVVLTDDGAGATLHLAWQGAPLPIGQLDRWLDEGIDRGLPGITGRAVLTAHATDLWPEATVHGQTLCLPLPVQRHAGPRPAPIARAVVYDFDLLSRMSGAGVADTRLADLTAVVFDTETTGLLPDQGDEIVQIAAIRIVNGRYAAGEVFDTLVNPARPIPARSSAVHGITDAMVAAAPPIAIAGRDFHRFAQGAVLVAHNAPFDMAFLRRHEPAIGAPFDHPVLDTVLLSAVVFGQSAEHSLDALTHRLGITIPEEARHTAIGDARATAEAFLRLIPMLDARGFSTFGQVLAEVRRHGRLLKDLN